MKPTTSKAHMNKNVRIALNNPNTRKGVLKGVYTAGSGTTSKAVKLDGKYVVFSTKPLTGKTIRKSHSKILPAS